MWPTLLVSLAIGGASFYALFDLTRIFGNPTGDVAQALTGSYAYLDSPWGLPLFWTDRINAPEGASIVFTDSVPLVALPLKALHSLGGLRLNSVPVWYMIAWLGQAIAGALLARELGVRNLWALSCAAVVALTMPTFLFRGPHVALSAHFLILLALSLYFRQQRRDSSRQNYSLWLILLGAATWVHAYLAAIIFCVFLAGQLDHARRFGRPLRTAARRTMVALSVMAGLALVGGYQPSGGLEMGGYNMLSMNLLSPVWPVMSAYFGGDHPKTTGGQYEGFQYLGLANILMIAAAAGSAARDRAWREARWLVTILVLLTLYALSDAVWMGETLLVDVNKPDTFPFTVFRAAGRMFWPVAYALTFWAFATVFLWLTRRSVVLASITVLAVAGSQGIEAWPLIERRASPEHSYPMPKLEEAVARASYVSVMPDWGCRSNGDTERLLIQAAVFLAAKHRKVVSTAYLARGFKTSCDGSTGEGIEGALTVYLPTASAVPPSPCFRTEGPYLCGAFAEVVAQQIGLERMEIPVR